MKKLLCLTLLSLSPLAAQAACVVLPLTTGQMSYNSSYEAVSGQIVKGEECRGVSTHASYTADQYSFQGTAGDSIGFYADTSFGLNVLVSILDPQGIQTSNDANNYNFNFRLTATGVYKIIVTGATQDAADVKSESIDYRFRLTSTNPKQSATPPVSTTCAPDTFNNGKLTINSVEVPNGLGSTTKYSATLSLQPFANPLTFTLDSATPLQ